MADRYARQRDLPGWHQQRLAAARVIVAGMGALGNEVSRLLALSGVGALLLCDPDRVEPSNLSRTGLFGPADLGRLKVEAARRPLRRLRPGLQLATRALPHVHGIGLGELAHADLVISCLDSRHARLQLAGRCNLVGAPLLDGGTHAWGGEVRPFLDAHGPCYGCGLSPADRAATDAPLACGHSPEAPALASAVVAATVGAAMAALAVRFLMGQTVEHRFQVLDLNPPAFRWTQPSRDPDCLLHQPLPPARPLPLSHSARLGELLALLPAGAEPQRWCPPPGDKQTLSLANQPAHLTLAELGLAPADILPVYLGESLDFIALAPSPDWPFGPIQKKFKKSDTIFPAIPQ